MSLLSQSVSFLSQAEIDSLLCCVYDIPCYVYLKTITTYKIIELNYDNLKKLGIEIVIKDNEINDDDLIRLLRVKKIELLLINQNLRSMIISIHNRVNNVDDSDFGLPNTILDKNDMDYCKKILEQYPEYTI